MGRTTRLGLLMMTTGVFAGGAHAAITGFGDGSGYTLTGYNSDDFGTFVSAGAPTISSGTLTLTTVAANESRQAYYNTKQSVGSFAASFVFRNDPAVQGPVGVADGFTLVFQNDPRGLAATGGIGASLGYGAPNAITNSAALQFYLRQGTAGAVGYQAGGAIDFADATPTGAVDLIDGDRIRVGLVYDGTTITETLVDLDNPASTFSTSFAANIPAAVGAATAYVGFTGGTGGGQTIQTLSNFTFGAVPEPTSLTALAGVVLLAGRWRKSSALHNVPPCRWVSNRTPC